MLVMRDASLGLEAILAPQPFRERPGADADLGAPQHRTQEPDLGAEIPLRMPPRLALYADLAFGSPEQSPFRGKVFHLDHIRLDTNNSVAGPSRSVDSSGQLLVASRKKSERVNLHSISTEPASGAHPITSGFSSAAVANSYNTTEHFLPSHRTPIATKVECCTLVQILKHCSA